MEFRCKTAKTGSRRTPTNNFCEPTLFYMEKTTFVNGYVLYDCEEGTFLVDTGSPFSFSEKGSISVCGTRHTVTPNLLKIDKTYISNKVGKPVDGLLGMDILNQYPMVFDYANDRFAIGERLVGGTAIESSLLMGLVVIKVQIGDQSVKLFLDSGAVISYISEEYTSGCPSVGVAEDFSPLLESDADTFKTNLYEVPVGLALQQKKIQFGNLPQRLEMMIEMMGAKGAIGRDLLEQCVVGIESGKVSIKFSE